MQMEAIISCALGARNAAVMAAYPKRTTTVNEQTVGGHREGTVSSTRNRRYKKQAQTAKQRRWGRRQQDPRDTKSFPHILEYAHKTEKV